MQEVELFGKPEEKAPDSPTNKEKRPPKISVAKVISSNHKWRECKIIGKNISIRSYSAACLFKDRVYLHGGYQILNGSLSDFYSISLEDAEEYFNWEEVAVEGQASPGSRSKHALLPAQAHIYLVGGLLSNNSAANDIWRFSPLDHKWQKLEPAGDKLPPLESFGAIVVGSQAEERIIIACGFNEEIASPVNTVYEYHIAQNKLNVLFEGKPASENVISPRHGISLTGDDKNLYIFGGKSEEVRYNDLWKFSLTQFKYIPLKNQGMVPASRNGHTMSHHNNRLYVFGGIHDITWELDDLHIYDLNSEKWTTLEQDSPRKVEKKKQTIEDNQKIEREKSVEKNRSPGKRWNNTSGAHNPTSPGKPTMSLTYEDSRGQSPGRMLDEQRRKVFYQKKAEMLKNFEITKEEKKKLVVLETSSQAMKNSLDVIGDPDPKHKAAEDKLTDFGKESVSKFLEPLHDHSNFIVGKKPCARDGHCAVMVKDELVIMVGDRHQMSFNDIYKLNLTMAQKDLPV